MSIDVHAAAAAVWDRVVGRHRVQSVGGGICVDLGVDAGGSLSDGVALAELCTAGLMDVSVTPSRGLGPGAKVDVRTDHPVEACLATQYAGWPVQTDGYFAMGSGSMRAARGREPMLESLGLVSSTSGPIVGVLESERMPGEDVVALVADHCGVRPGDVRLAVAPSTSLAGTVQVVARTIETAMHKLHELDFDVRTVQSAVGTAPLPPPAAAGDTIGGIGRTNDAILYGGEVFLWVDTTDEAIESVIAGVPSSSSGDHGRPFAEIFRRYDGDFYKVDPMLFSPAVLGIANLRTGHAFTSGQTDPEILRESFGL